MKDIFKEITKDGLPYKPVFKVRFFKDREKRWDYILCVEDHGKGYNWRQYNNGTFGPAEKNRGTVLGNVLSLVDKCVRTKEWIEINEDQKKLPPPSKEPHWSELPKYQKRKVSKKPWQVRGEIKNLETGEIIAAGHKG